MDEKMDEKMIELNFWQVQDVAIRCIQRNVRKLQAVRVWPWWRLMLRLSPLLNVHRTEEELKARTVIEWLGQARPGQAGANCAGQCRCPRCHFTSF